MFDRMGMRSTRAWLVVTVMWMMAGGLAWSEPPEKGSRSVEGFSVTYDELPTPEEGWGTSREAEWLTSLTGTLRSEKTLAYRQAKLPAGTHDVWVEKGKGDWFYLLIGKKDEPEAPRLKSMFRLYELEKGVTALRLQLKLTRRATKLKFSVFVGTSEGHGNLRILPPEEKKAP